MSNKNLWRFVLENRAWIHGPILEIGSKSYGGTTYHDFRDDFPRVPYVGVDLEAGRGVDILCDFTKREEVQSRVGVGSFGTVICLSVIEHCPQPFHMAENITSVLPRRGTLLLSVPFVWRQHGFPDDYWRFTASAVRVLFPAFRVIEEASYCTTKILGKKLPLTEPNWMPPKVEGMSYSLYPVQLNMLLVKT